MEAHNDLKNIDFGEDIAKVGEYLTTFLEKNADILEIVATKCSDLSVIIFTKLQKCCATSCVIERSFSMLGKLLIKDRIFLP